MLSEINANSYNQDFSTASKLKDKNLNADEFQATLNELKKKESKAQEDKKLENVDLDLSAAKSDFIAYAQNKVYQDGLKKIEQNELNKLFALIDKNNEAR